ncbi:acyl carrier protein [Neptuniibacter sp.]|uniref:acyl carrier protein n=1 Tax=Neptuniibacter sp. TaxID=1962643 RepID=UPI003B5B584D
MTPEQIKAVIEEELLELAPEADLDDLDAEEDMREELDLDSMDFLRLTLAISKRLNVAIPDTDLAKVVTFNAMYQYLLERGAKD